MRHLNAILIACILLLTGCTNKPVESGNSRQSETSTAQEDIRVYYSLSEFDGDSFAITATYEDLFTLTETFRSDDSVSFVTQVAPGKLSAPEEIAPYLKGVAAVSFSVKNDPYTISKLRKPLLLEINKKDSLEELYARASAMVLTKLQLPKVNSIQGHKLTLEKYNIRIKVGESRQIVIDCLPEGYSPSNLSFLSDNKRAVVVNDAGVVTGVQNGAASVGVALAGTTARATVTVVVTS